jgi:putative spermidine/putrescine transport system substrate-binding protein
MGDRRTLLIGAGALTLNYLLAGCRASGKASLFVRPLQDSIPPQILAEFQRQTQGVEFRMAKQLADLFQQLQDWQHPEAAKSGGLPFSVPGGSAKSDSIADLVTLGDYWLKPAIQQGLIQPLPVETVAGWQQLPQPWQQLVRRDAQGLPSASGQLWAAPYRWGSLVIAYHSQRFKKLGWTPTDWKDLWRPELKGQISLLDSGRATIGLTLKKLGQSVNAGNLQSVPNLAAELKALHQQVKFYSSDAYLQPLLLEDTWAAVGWSTEVLPVVQRDRRLAAVVPNSGTILTADLWVRPVGSTADIAKLAQWLEFCWQPAIAAQISTLSLAASPVVAGCDRSQLPTALQQNSLLLPSPELLGRSEFLLPVNSEEYLRLWETTRRMG